MRKLTCLALALCFISSQAQAADSLRWSDLLAPSSKSNIDVCIEAQRVAKMPLATPEERVSHEKALRNLRSPYELYDVNGKISFAILPPPRSKNFIFIQTPNGVFADLCAKIVTQGRPFPRFNLYLPVFIHAKEIKADPLNVPEARISMLDAKGKVLMTLKPSGRLRRSYNPGSCTGSNCSWEGIYIYEFQPKDQMRSILSKADRMKISFNRGKGPESRIYTPRLGLAP